jgi:benzodiazapine receptor
MITPRHAIGLVVSLGICFGAAGLGSLFTKPSIGGWYVTLRKPPWTPPNWLFGPVWSVLYLSMAIAAWLVWRKVELPGAKLALLLFAIQFALNIGWSGIFFTLHRPGAALIEVLLLWISILATVWAFWPLSRAAGWLMVPYLAWVAFASTLNYAIWRLNA